MLYQRDKSDASRTWLNRNLTILAIVGCVLVIGLLQWPAVKGLVHRAISSPAADRISWRTDYLGAVTESQATGKPLLLDFTASWCPPCQMMKQEVWPDQAVEAFANGKFIPVAIDVDNELVATTRYHVSSIPTIITISSAGDVQKRIGYLSAPELLDFMGESLHSSQQASAAETSALPQ